MTEQFEPRKPRLLVADDEAAISLSIRFLLQDEYDVEVADTAEEAIANLSDDLALVLLDLCMPGVSGCELLKRIHTIVPHVPVAILSATQDDDIRNEITRCGAVALIEKPFCRRELLTRIQDILKETKVADG